MNLLKLDVHSGLPMYFINEKIGVNKRKINFSNTDNSQVGDELELGMFIYRIDEIKKIRPFPLNYPTVKPVFFHSTHCTAVRKIDMVRTAEGMKRVETVVV